MSIPSPGLYFKQKGFYGNNRNLSSFSDPSSFSDKGGGFMGKYGDMIGGIGSTLAMMINANKKQDPTGRPYKTGTKKLNTNMKKSNKNLIKYQGGNEYAEAEQMKANAEDRKRAFLANTIEANSPTDMRRVTATSTFTPANVEGPRTSQTTQAARRRGSDKVRAYQQKLKNLGYKIKVDGFWGRETQRVHNAYVAKKNATVRKTIPNPTKIQVASTPGSSNRFTFNQSDRANATDVIHLQYPGQDKPYLSSYTEDQMNNIRYGPGGGFQDKRTKLPKLEYKAPGSFKNIKDLLKNYNVSNDYIYPTEWRNRLIPDPKDNRFKDEGADNLKASPALDLDRRFYPNRPLSFYQKMDAKLGGLLPGGVNREQAKEIRVADRVERLKKKMLNLNEEYSNITGKELIKYKGDEVQKSFAPVEPVITKVDSGPIPKEAAIPSPVVKKKKTNKKGTSSKKKESTDIPSDINKDIFGSLDEITQGIHNRVQNKLAKGKSKKSVKSTSRYNQDPDYIKYKQYKAAEENYMHEFGKKMLKEIKEEDARAAAAAAAPAPETDTPWYDTDYNFGKEPGVGKAIGYVLSGFQDSPKGYTVNPLTTLKGALATYAIGKAFGSIGGRRVPKAAPRVSTKTQVPVITKPPVASLRPGPMPPVKGTGGKFQVNPAKKGQGTYTGKPVPFKSTGPRVSEIYRKPGTTNATAPAPAAVTPAKVSFKKKVWEGTKKAGKGVYEHVKRNPKKYATAAGLVGAGYAASKIRTGGE